MDFRVCIAGRVMLSYTDQDEANEMAERLSRQLPGYDVEVLEKLWSSRTPYRKIAVWCGGLAKWSAGVSVVRERELRRAGFNPERADRTDSAV